MDCSRFAGRVRVAREWVYRCSGRARWAFAGHECLARGLRTAGFLPEESLVFFDVHSVHDVKHAAQLQEALLRVTCTAQHLREVCDAAEESAETLYNFFESVFGTSSQ